MGSCLGFEWVRVRVQASRADFGRAPRAGRTSKVRATSRALVGLSPCACSIKGHAAGITSSVSIQSIIECAPHVGNDDTFFDLNGSALFTQRSCNPCGQSITLKILSLKTNDVNQRKL